jgi:hypothetical protein
MSYPQHKDSLGMLGDIDFKALLKNQQELDAADARRIEEKERTKEAEDKEKERMEKVKKREQNMLEIAGVEHELQAWKNVLCITDKGTDNDDDNCSDSAVKGPPVRLIYYMSFRFKLIVIHNYVLSSVLHY